MDALLTYLSGIGESANSIVADATASGGNVFQMLSFAFNLLPYFAIAAIAILVFNACWSWRLLKPVIAISGAVIFGLVGQFISVSLCASLGSSTFLSVISIPGVLTAGCAILGAVLCYFIARLFMSLSVGVSVMAIISGLIGGTAGLIVGIIVGLIAFVLVLIFFKQIYVFINSVLGMLVAGMIAGLTLTSSVDYAFVGITAMILCGIIGLIFGIKLFKKQFED